MSSDAEARLIDTNEELRTQITELIGKVEELTLKLKADGGHLTKHEIETLDTVPGRQHAMNNARVSTFKGGIEVGRLRRDDLIMLVGFLGKDQNELKMRLGKALDELNAVKSRKKSGLILPPGVG